jgi:hypothetical protein
MNFSHSFSWAASNNAIAVGNRLSFCFFYAQGSTTLLTHGGGVSPM